MVAVALNQMKAIARAAEVPPEDRHADPRMYLEPIEHRDNSVEAQLAEAAELTAKREAKLDDEWNENVGGALDLDEPAGVH